MKDSKQSSGNAKDLGLYFLILAITSVAVVFTYFYSITTPIKILVWIGWLVLSSIIGYFTTKGQAIALFAAEAKIELEKVVWPTRQETLQTTALVIAMVAITGVILWTIDSLMMWAIAKITHLG